MLKNHRNYLIALGRMDEEGIVKCLQDMSIEELISLIEALYGTITVLNTYVVARQIRKGV
jgi:hypothetical protein